METQLPSGLSADPAPGFPSLLHEQEAREYHNQTLFGSRKALLSGQHLLNAGFSIVPPQLGMAGGRMSNELGVMAHDSFAAVRSAPVSVRLMPGGHVTLPRTFTKALGIQEGDNVTLRLEGDELRLYSRATAIKRMQNLVARHVPAGVKLTDELIAERRREARREADSA